MFVYNNKDKEWQKDELKGDQQKGFRRGSRCILTSVPNQGKTNLLKNLIAETSPPFDLIYVHKMPQSKEYDCLEHIHLNNLRDMPPIEGNQKVLLVMEDFSKRAIKNKDDEKRLLDILGYECSHHGLTLAILAQNFFEIPLELRRRSDVFVVWPTGADLDLIMKRLTISKNDKKRLQMHIDMTEHQNHDAYMIDLARPEKERIRFNNELISI